MSNHVNQKVKHEPKKVTLSSWDDVIADVGCQIKETEERLKGLKRVARNFQALKDSGQSFRAATQN
jgi:hypothetical protein